MNPGDNSDNYDDLDVDELIELGVATTGSVFDELTAVTATASAGGVEVTVNLEGKLVGLQLEPHALAAGRSALAAEIFRLTQQASAEALTQGIAVLAPVAGAGLTAELRELAAPILAAAEPGAAEPTAAEPTAAEPVVAAKPARRALDDDFSAVESWAVR